MYKSKTNGNWAFYALAGAIFIFSACEKSDVSSSDQTTLANTIGVAASLSTVTSATAASAAGDSVYVMQNCGRGGKRDSIAQAALPANASTYLSTNYAGYTFHKAFAIKSSSGTTTGYVAIIYFNDKPVGVEFDSAGSFVKVLEQREKGDLAGKGHHRGGRFEHRDGGQRDTISLSALPVSVTSYFTANYASDTLVKAFRGRDSSTVVLSKNNGAFATVFNASGVFVKRTGLQTRSGSCQTIELSALPAVAANYLTLTYPNYVFGKAFSITKDGILKGFVVVIDANNTKYAVEFDASGSFVSAKTIR
jgi:hypothetical protein